MIPLSLETRVCVHSLGQSGCLFPSRGGVQGRRFKLIKKNFFLKALSLSFGLLFAAFVSATSPSRIITLAPNLTEMVYAVGAGHELVAVDASSDTPAIVKKLPVISDFEHINLEQVLWLKPDLILAWAGGNSEVQLNQLRSFGIPVEEISITDLRSIGFALDKVGRLTGHAAQGEALSKAFEQKYLALQKEYGHSASYPPSDSLRSSTSPSRGEVEISFGRERLEISSPLEGEGRVGGKAFDFSHRRVFIEISESPFYTPGKASFLTNILNLCGAESAFPLLNFEASPVSLESIIASNPDIIISLKPVDPNFWKNWPEINAVKHHKVYGIDPDILARPGPRVLEGAEKVCQWVSS